MTDSTPRDSRDGSRPPRPITAGRVTTWIVVGGIGVFLVVSGILGIVAKG